MPFTPDSLRRALFKDGSNDFQLLGLDKFANALEKDFFSSLYVNKLLTKKKECFLTLELTCNLTLPGLLYHFKKGEWGAFASHTSSLSKNLGELESKNSFPVDVEEFSIFLKDTAIIINRLHSQSIASQLETIISKIAGNYMNIIRKSGEMPFEIYVPVFDSNEEEEEDYGILNDEFVFVERATEEYYKYWGLYYESERDPFIYDVENQILLPGNLFVFP